KLLSDAGTSLEGFSAMRSLYNALLIVHEASRSPSPMLRARALGLRGLLRSVGLLRGGTQRGLDELESAWSTADRLGDLHERTDLRRQIAAAHYVHGNARGALESAERCEADLRVLPLPPRDLHRVMGVVGCMLWNLGELREARRRWTGFSHEAHHRRDVMTSFWIHANPAQLILLMASDDKSAASAMLEKQQRLCALHPHYKFLSWARAIGLGEHELYWGDPSAALGVVDAHWEQLTNVGYTLFDLHSHMLRARATQARAAELGRGRERERLLRRAQSITRSVRYRHRDPFGSAAASLLSASNAALRNRSRVALKHLDLAIAILEQRNEVMAACALYCKGALLGGARGLHLRVNAQQVLTAQDIVAPERWIRWVLPGFRSFVESDVASSR
ncbi:MAG TPA: hypothetical protein VMF89_30520, partial [Polyangiales bacterium]|nr:hypothetical protein [Polyangiales bacterium]